MKKTYLIKLMFIIVALVTWSSGFAQEPAEQEDAPAKPKTEKKATPPPADNKPSLTAEKADPGEELMKAANSLDTALRYKEAARLYKKAIHQNKENALAYLKLAIDYHELGKDKRAFEQLTLVIHLKPDFADAFIKRAEFETDAGPYKAAGEDLKKAIEAEPRNKMGYFQRGILEQKTHKLVDAINDFTTSLDIDHAFANALVELGHTRYLNKDYQWALIDLGKAEAIDPHSFKLYKYIGLCKMALHDNKNAVAAFDKALEINQFDMDVLANRTLAKINMNDYKSALEDCNKGLKFNPKDSQFYNFRGVAKSGTKDNKGALEDLNKAIALKADYSQAYVNRAAVKFAMGDKKGACEDLFTADGMANEMASKLVDKYCNKKLK